MCHVSWYFQVVKNPLFKSIVRRWGRAGPSRRRLAQPAPGPAGDIFEITSPSPTRSGKFQSHGTSARPGQRLSNLTGRLPGLARRDSHNIFAVPSCCVSSSRFRGTRVLVSPGPVASLGIGSLSTIGIRRRVCHAPIPAFGHRWCGVGYVVP